MQRTWNKLRACKKSTQTWGRKEAEVGIQQSGVGARGRQGAYTLSAQSVREGADRAVSSQVSIWAWA